MKSIAIFLLLILSISVFGYEEEGEASWYGGKFQGRTTANGEIFDTYLFTAAHKTLPFGSLVKVTNIESNLSVIVRINDRGPFIEGRIIDLSMAAAKIIGLVRSGHSPVIIEVIGQSQTNPTEENQAGLNPPQESSEPEITAQENHEDVAVTQADTKDNNQEVITESETLTDNNVIQTEVPPIKVHAPNIVIDTTLSIQVGSFFIEENAGNLKQLLESQSFIVRLESVSSGFTRVIITQINNEDLERTKQILSGLGITDVIVREENNS